VYNKDMKYIKMFLGEVLFRLYNNHLGKALNQPYANYDNYSTFGLGRFKFDIISKYATDLANHGDFTGCAGFKKVDKMHKWYEYSYIYFRALENKSLIEKIKILFS